MKAYQAPSVRIALPPDPDLLERVGIEITSLLNSCEICYQASKYRGCIQHAEQVRSRLRSKWRQGAEMIVLPLGDLKERIAQGNCTEALASIQSLRRPLATLPKLEDLHHLQASYFGKDSCIEQFTKNFTEVLDNEYYPRYNLWVSGGRLAQGLDYFQYWDEQRQKCPLWLQQARGPHQQASIFIQRQMNLQFYTFQQLGQLERLLSKETDCASHEIRLELVRLVARVLSYVNDTESIAVYYSKLAN